MVNRRQQQEYDVCIVGSGAGGGMAAKVLAGSTARCVLAAEYGAWTEGGEVGGLTVRRLGGWD